MSVAHDVRIEHVTKRFQDVTAVDDLTLDIEAGKFYALLGPSGCGKTTALRIVAGFETADTGSVLVDGKDISSVPAARRDMGMVFQSYSLFPNMSAQDNVGFGLRMRKLGSAARQRRAAAARRYFAPRSRRELRRRRLHVDAAAGPERQRVAVRRARRATTTPHRGRCHE